MGRRRNIALNRRNTERRSLREGRKKRERVMKRKTIWDGAPVIYL